MTAWVSKRLDFSTADWLFALKSCVLPAPADPAGRVERLWSPGGQGMAGLSVRTLFDLYLAAHGWGPGDRIVFTALTVADMPRIARAALRWRRWIWIRRPPSSTSRAWRPC